MSVTVDINNFLLRQMVDELVNDDTTMLEVHNTFAKRCDPYVPMAEGPLSQSALAQVTPQYVQYGNESVPYAHYHYEGEVYGLNIPIIENGIVVGWFSLPDENGHKHPTGRQLQYTKAKASRHWDEAMMAEKREEFVKQVHDILARRARNGS